ncbi:hypothetical protein [Francisella sp. 19S2-10]|uniref:hypothetical protein n=1 Tax=Francisella sp. 19S2-10 TaxID=3087176 RepID=UPI002E2EF2E0|nr:hypothetical protein [Francisella sp. 19S2-10]MED7819071.1 hypothetical protein [Francisella sp. 19S2-4]MED7829908.1 hypothetical protein [Francisella sp. 19S2-10]
MFKGLRKANDKLERGQSLPLEKRESFDDNINKNKTRSLKENSKKYSKPSHSK